MTSIANLFSNFNDLVKPKSVTDNASDYNKNNSNPISLSLNQGRKFKKYQKKIEDNLEEKAVVLSGVEGFQQPIIKPGPDDTLTKQTIDVLEKTNISRKQQQTVEHLRTEYASTMTQYEKLLATITGGTTDYINRVSPNNPYLGKVIQLQGGAIFYVTNQGVAKYIPSMDIYDAVAGKNGFPAKGEFTQVSIPWSASYSNQGATLPTKPPLITGTPVQVGQSVGNEGSNVYVNTMISNPTTSYKGCYADNASTPSAMTFIGGSPPPPNTVAIQNGNFSEPQLSNNSYAEYIGTNTAVPGWYFNAFVVNNFSGLANYMPIPYPGGNQCAYIYSNQYIYQVLNLTAGTYTLSFSASSSYAVNPLTITIASTNSTPTQATQTFNVSAPQGSWTPYTETFTITTSGPFQITFTGTSGYQASVITNVSLTTSGNSTSDGTYTYDMCEQSAINGGYQYFALQNVNTDSSKGYCAVSNDEITSTKNGKAFVVSKQIDLWNSKTAGQSGNTCSFNNGSINILNSSGAAVFATPNTTAQPSNYIGCYADQSARAMALYNKGSQQYNNSECQQIAQSQNASYFGLQNSTSGQNAQCVLSSNLSQAQQYGVAKNCTQISDGSWSGGGWSNAVYSTTNPTNNYFLILQDDGNMCIYLGSGPNDNQGEIWSSMTNGKQQQGNPKMVAANNKFGQNWMPNGSALAPGEYLSSTNGNLVLIMQGDGNLVLYTYQLAENSRKMADGNTGGGIGANALYKLNEVGVPANLSQLGYVDQDAQLHTYPSTNVTYGNTYTTINDTAGGGAVIPGSISVNSTVEKCQTACNSNNECVEFTFANNWIGQSNVCFLQSSNTNNQSAPGYDLYVRNKVPISPPIGVQNTTNNIDTVLYQNYINGGAIKESYGLTKATSVQKQQLQQMQTKMNLLSNQINNLTNQFSSGGQQVQQQSQTNLQEINKYVKDIKKTNKKIQNYNGSNYENILQDSDIVVLKQNYDYLFWSIIAITTVIISMNIVKK
jgi:hypothetical protein